MLDVNERQSFRARELFRDFKYLYFLGFQNSINISHLLGMKEELLGALQSGFQLHPPVPCPLRNISVRQPQWQNAGGVIIQNTNSLPHIINVVP